VTPRQTTSSNSVRFGLPSPGDGSPAFGLGGTLAGVVIVALVLGGFAWSAALGKTDTARHPDLFGGDVVLEDTQHPLAVVDVATAQVTERLYQVFDQVHADNYADVQTVALDEGTMLVNRVSGTFNLLGKDDYLIDTDGTGVGLGNLSGTTGAVALGAGSSAYIIRSAPDSTVSLVDQNTVEEAAKLEGQPAPGKSGSARSVNASPASALEPRGFAALGGRVSLRAGSAAVAGGDLWVLVPSRPGCSLVQLRPISSGLGLAATTRSTVAARCTELAVESADGLVGEAEPGRVSLFSAQGTAPLGVVAVPGTSADTQFLPVTGSATDDWYLGRGPSGWSVFGISPSDEVSGPSLLRALGPSSDPAVPAMSNGFVYTLDQAAPGQPTLWEIDAQTGGMAPLAGTRTYPRYSPTERAVFEGVQVMADGPRVIYNNPGSIMAVVVFTDGSHAPVAVDKLDAATVSATGPADLNVTSPAAMAGRPSARANPAQARALPVVQPVDVKLTCATTTEKPYAPVITSVAPASGSALIAWSYQLLDQTDCEPDSWSVQVKALTGSHQPPQPLQVVNGQDQYTFTGLRPATTYQVIVTAYINAQSTPSSPVTFTTAERGPDAPLSVSTRVNAAGDWVVTWKACTPAVRPTCIVPAATWTVTGSACGGTFVGQPPSLQVAGGQTSATIDADSLGLLGDSLSFSVQGALVTGLAGNPTSDNQCTEAWRAPRASAITLSGAATPVGLNVTASLQVNTVGSPVEAFGSQNTNFVYALGGFTVGPTTHTTVTVPGLLAGQSYTPTVTVYPAGHPAASVTITGDTFTKTLAWPAVSLSPVPSVDQAAPSTGSLGLSFQGLPPNLPAGEIVAAGTLTCSNWSAPIGGGLADGELTPAYQMADLNDEGTDCSVSVVLSDTAKPDPYGVSSNPISAGPFDFGPQLPLQFDAYYGPIDCGSDPILCLTPSYPINVYYGAPGQQAQPPFGRKWAVQATVVGPANQGTLCQSETEYPATFPAQVSLSTSCGALAQRPNSTVTVAVAWTYLGVSGLGWAGTVQGQQPSPPTTTTTTTTTVPCPSTTIASSTTTSSSTTSSSTTSSSTTSSSTTTSSTSTTTPCGTIPAASALAAATTQVPPGADPVAVEEIGAVLAATGLIWGSLRLRGRRWERGRRGERGRRPGARPSPREETR
jgi:hypothetical protein